MLRNLKQTALQLLNNYHAILVFLQQAFPALDYHIKLALHLTLSLLSKLIDLGHQRAKCIN